MATNKNQHFVPRCYLRAFTEGENGKTICVFNLDRMKMIRGAPVRHQCARSYFYGQDAALEKAMQASEGLYASTVRRVLSKGYNLSTGDRRILLRFWLLQFLRTEAASRRSVEMFEQIGGAVAIEDERFRLQIQDAVRNAMRTYVSCMDLVDDLRGCLLMNRSGVPFFSSDDPAVLTNRWYLQDRRTRGRSFGIRSAGCLAILPLSPSVCFLGYDGDVYRVRSKDGWISLRRTTAVETLNSHQFLGCCANVFAHEAAFGSVAAELYSRTKSRRPGAKHKINLAIEQASGDGGLVYKVVDSGDALDGESVLVHSQSIHPEPAAWPSFLKWNSAGGVYSNGSALGYVRWASCSNEGGRPFVREAVGPLLA